MKEGWKLTKLSSLGSIKGGKRVPKGYKLQKESTFWPYIRVTDFTDDGTVDLSDIHYVTEEIYNQIKSYTISSEDVYISIAGTIGKSGIVPIELNGANLTENACKIVLNETLNKYFLLYYTKSHDFQVQIGLNTRTTAMPKLSLSRLSTIMIPIPPYEEQQQIVSILDEAFAAVDKAKANIERNLQNAKELFQSELDAVFSQKGEGLIEKELKDILIKTETIDPTKFPDNDYVYIDVSAVNRENLRIEDVSFIKGKQAPSRARKLIKTDDIIFATVRPTLKRIAIIQDKYNLQVCSTGYFVLRASESINYKLLFYFLQTTAFLKSMEKLQKGASYPAVTDGEVKSQKITFPIMLTEQEILAKQLDSLYKNAKKLQELYTKKLSELEDLKKSILQKAFSGELKTKDIETVTA